MPLCSKDSDSLLSEMSSNGKQSNKPAHVASLATYIVRLECRLSREACSWLRLLSFENYNSSPLFLKMPLKKQAVCLVKGLQLWVWQMASSCCL